MTMSKLFSLMFYLIVSQKQQLALVFQWGWWVVFISESVVFNFDMYVILVHNEVMCVSKYPMCMCFTLYCC